MPNLPPTASELEAYIVGRDDPRFVEAPEPARRLYAQEVADGVPTALALHQQDWYVIQTSGQGGYIIWDWTTQECDRELLAKVYEEGFLAGRVAPSDFVLGEHANPYRTGWHPAAGLHKDLLKQLHRVLDVAVPVGLRLACTRSGGQMSAHTGTTQECGECEICKLRAIVSPLIQWVRLGWRSRKTLP